MKEGITHILAKVSVYDEWFDEGADCVLIPIEMMERAKQYAEQIERMKTEGLEPSRISEFNYEPIWLQQLPAISEEFAEKILVIDGNNFIDYEGAVSPDDFNPVCNNEEDVEDNRGGDLTTDCNLLNSWKDTFSVSCHVKHTDVEMEAIIYYTSLNEAPTLAEVLKKQEETA